LASFPRVRPAGLHRPGRRRRRFLLLAVARGDSRDEGQTLRFPALPLRRRGGEDPRGEPALRRTQPADSAGGRMTNQPLRRRRTRRAFCEEFAGGVTSAAKKEGCRPMSLTTIRLSEAWNWGGLSGRQLLARTWAVIGRHETLDRAAVVAYY